jgi:hypothetical protein
MLIATCCTSNRRMWDQNEGNNLQAGRTIYNDLGEPQDLSSGHTSLLLRQFV